VRFWDSSALAPLFLDELSSIHMRQFYGSDPEIVIWTFARVELLSAFARRRREDEAVAHRYEAARDEFLRVSLDWSEVAELVAVRRHAERVVEKYPLRAADALQLGAALVAADGQPDSLEFVTLDRRLADAASREGFPILGVS
jgi:predicted nucleic acid-binding protein